MFFTCSNPVFFKFYLVSTGCSYLAAPQGSSSLSYILSIFSIGSCLYAMSRIAQFHCLLVSEICQGPTKESNRRTSCMDQESGSRFLPPRNTTRCEEARTTKPITRQDSRARGDHFVSCCHDERKCEVTTTMNMTRNCSRTRIFPPKKKISPAAFRSWFCCIALFRNPLLRKDSP
jgi:hypothetical protein